VAVSGTGNTRSAKCTTSALAAGTASIAARYGGNSANTASISATLSQLVKPVSP
jgi:hypothetical protein